MAHPWHTFPKTIGGKREKRVFGTFFSIFVAHRTYGTWRSKISAIYDRRGDLTERGWSPIVKCPIFPYGFVGCYGCGWCLGNFFFSDDDDDEFLDCGWMVNEWVWIFGWLVWVFVVLVMFLFGRMLFLGCGNVCLIWSNFWGGERVFERVCFFLKQKRADHFSSLCFSNWHAFARPIYIAFCSEQQQTKQQKQKTNNKKNKQTKTPSINHQTICCQHTHTHVCKCMYVCARKKKGEAFDPVNAFLVMSLCLIKGVWDNPKEEGWGHPLFCFVFIQQQQNGKG